MPTAQPISSHRPATAPPHSRRPTSHRPANRPSQPPADLQPPPSQPPAIPQPISSHRPANRPANLPANLQQRAQLCSGRPPSPALGGTPPAAYKNSQICVNANRPANLQPPASQPPRAFWAPSSEITKYTDNRDKKIKTSPRAGFYI